MNKVRIGVLGGMRGDSMISYCKVADNVELVAICDKNPDVLELQKSHAKGLNIAFYDNFDEFILHDMDAVVLANYANEHAPFAIRAMKAGKHVFSEVLPVQTMKEAVELIEAVEETGMIYAYGENYCYMGAPYEMKKRYEKGTIGDFQYGEGEYIHNCESIWPSITYGEENHWRNLMYSTFYCTHSAGPLIHMTGLRPVKVVGFEGTDTALCDRMGSKSGLFGIEMITLENGGIIKSIHGNLYTDSVWYCAYGSKGRMECGREDTDTGSIDRIFVRSDKVPGEYKTEREVYDPARPQDDLAQTFGHGNSDFYTMWHFVEKIKGNPEADIVDVYEAMDMFLPGMFAYRSILNGGIPMDIPNLRDKSVRDAWRNDVACTDAQVAGDQLLPTRSAGTPTFDPAVYDRIRILWEEEEARRIAWEKEQAEKAEKGE